MDSKLPVATDEGVPAYSEKAPDWASPAHQTCPAPSLSSLRTQRIENFVDIILTPHLLSQFTDGIYKRILLLLPSDTLPAHPTLAPKDITSGLPTTSTGASPTTTPSDIVILRLPSSSPAAPFWLHGTVAQELASLIRRKLRDMGQVVIDPVPFPHPKSPLPISPTSPASPPQTSSKSWFKRATRAAKSELSDAQDPKAVWTTDAKLGWRAEGEGQAVPQQGEEERRGGRELGQDEVSVRVWTREISFRAATEMGLWETVGARMVGVEVEVGAG